MSEVSVDPRVRAIAVGAIVVLLCVAAAEAAVRTNPITHPPRVTRELGAPGLVTLRPSVAASLSAPCAIVATQGELTVVAGEQLGFATLVPDSSGVLRETARLDLPGPPMAIALSGDTAAVACAWGGTVFFDVSKPSSPSLIGAVPCASSARAVSLAGDHAYVADWDSGMQVIRLVSGIKPQSITFANTPGHAYDVAVNGSKAYIADFEGGVRVFDITNPFRPATVGSWAMMPSATGVTAIGSTVYVVDEQKGLFVVDVADIETPKVLSEVRTEVSARKIEVLGDVAFISDPAGGVTLLDVSEPRGVRNLGRTQIGATVVGVAPQNGRAYLAAGHLLVAETPR